MDQEVVNIQDNEELLFLAERLTVIKERYDQLPDSIPRRLTIPAIFGRAGNENFISDYIAYILDPERNGIGTEPLQALLSLAFENVADIDLEQVDIKREYEFDDPSLGRIDFLIQLGEQDDSGVIGIENKIYSSEGVNQTNAYAKGIKEDFKDCGDHYLIFLTPDGRLPVSKDFRAVSYIDLLQSLREIRYPVLNDIHKSVIWEDFLAHLEEYIVMVKGKLELSGKTRLYLEYRKELEGLNYAYQQDANKVYDHVIASIQNAFDEGWQFNFLGRNSYQEIRRNLWDFSKFYLFYQYLFSRDNLLKRERIPSFMLGVYPKNTESRQFYDWLKSNYPKIEEICALHDIEAYPSQFKGTKSHLIAYKEWPITDDLGTIDRPFIQVMEEFSAFTPIMDDAVHAFKKLNPVGS